MPSADVLTTIGNVRETTLGNGLRILVQEIHTSPLVSVWCWYRVGSGDEPAGLTGVSHWVEHMNFKGTESIPREEMKGIVERAGGMWNGYTWIDQTTYLETAASSALDQMLFIEAERMARGLYDPADCEAERTVIISELQGGDNDPEQLLDTEVTATALRVHPYGHPTIGWLQDLQAMSRDDLYTFYKRHYVPNNATLVVVGDVDADDVFRKAEARFGRIPAGSIVRNKRMAEPRQVGERRVLLERDGTTAYLKLAYPAPAATEADFFPMLVLDAALTGAKGVSLWNAFRDAPPQRKARLYSALVERGLATSVSGSLLPTSDPFLFTVSLTAAAGVSLDRLEEAALAEIDRARRGGLSAQEITRAKRQLRTRLVLENDSVTSVAHQLGYFSTVAGPHYLSQLQTRIDAVTPEDVARIAAERLGGVTRTVGRFQPLGEAA
ncbi:MAG TPA: pitrilysin family protein [Vicinamibacterales bacterium]|nr:pitrilysin family protein [Vicinamibacterales bacterium]